MLGSAFVFFGFTSRAMTPACGTSSESSSRRFGVSSSASKLTPVRLPPGLARLATRPSSTASAPILKTIGIVEVALFAANAVGRRPWRQSRQPCGRRARWPMRAADHSGPSPRGIRSPRSVPRHSLSFSPWRNAATYGANAPGEAVLRMPITGIALCCARRGQATAVVPPSSSSNSRRLICRPPLCCSPCPRSSLPVLDGSAARRSLTAGCAFSHLQLDGEAGSAAPSSYREKAPFANCPS